MKRILSIIILIGAVAMSYCFASLLIDKVKTGEEIANSIRKGDYNGISKHFDVTIELTLPGNEGTYSKTQAEMILKDFFIKYPPQSFTVKNTGSDKTGTEYTIGDLKTEKGEFRAYYLLKEKSGKYFIQQLKFEKN
jgi:hypothetical protein